MRDVFLIGFLLVLFNTAVFTRGLHNHSYKYRYHARWYRNVETRKDSALEGTASQSSTDSDVEVSKRGEQILPVKYRYLTPWFRNVGTRKNWALNGTAAQSSMNNAVEGPEKAVDGDRTNVLSGESCAISLLSRDPWWLVHLQQRIRVEQVFIVNRVDGKNLLDFWIYIMSRFIENTRRLYTGFRYAGYCLKFKGHFPVGGARLLYCEHPVVGEVVKLKMYDSNKRISLCEVEVYGTQYLPDSGSLNWARGLPATQSSESATEWGKAASNAVDGDYNCDNNLGSFTQTSQNDKNPWWMVDLQQVLVITHVKVFNRMDCCQDRLHEFEIMTLFYPNDHEQGICWFRKEAVLSKSNILPCALYVKGRYVRINFYGDVKMRPLSLCEVEVTGWKLVADPEYYKSRDNEALDRRTSQSTTYEHRDSHKAVDGNAVNHWFSNTCTMTAIDDNHPWWKVDLGGKMFVEAVLMFFPLESVEIISENWSVYKPAWQSSTRWGLTADKAVDGGYMCHTIRYTYTYTDPDDKYPWWMVNLQFMIMVKEVKIFNRQDCCMEHLHTFFIEVLQSKDEISPGVCHHQYYHIQYYAVFPCNRYLRGQYVRIWKEGPVSGGDILSLCEVEVKGVKLVESKDWAKQMPAFQSSTAGNMSADLAVDGKNNCSVHGSFSHTYEHDLNAWWMVDLKQTLMVTEVIIYNPHSDVVADTTSDNWAWKRPAYQSTTQGNNVADRAVDGNIDSDLNHGSCTLTANGDLDPWWMVDLQMIIMVKKVKVVNQKSCCALHDFYIDILQHRDESSPSVCHHQKEAAEKSATFSCNPPVKGQYVRIRKHIEASHDFLSLCEVEVNGIKTDTSIQNWAWKMPTSQSSTHENFGSERAVDGKFDSNFYHGSCSCTGMNDAKPWWMVNLLQLIEVKEVVLINREDSNVGNRLHDFYVEILQHEDGSSPSLCYHQTQRVDSFVKCPCNPPLKGQYVRIRKEKPVTYDDVLTLCEVEVKGKKIAHDSYNWAWKRPAFQSTTYGDKGADRAVDGNNDSNYNHGSCTSTAVGDSHPWWLVDLEVLIMVDMVVVYNRMDCCAYRLHSFYVEIMHVRYEHLPSVCHYQKHAIGTTATFLCNPSMRGRYVKIRKETLIDGNDLLSLCEVEVRGGERVHPGMKSPYWSRGMRAFQSSEGGKPASLAVDGNYSCNFNGSYSYTSEQDKSPWWMVDLEQYVLISGVQIVHNISCCGGQPLWNFFIEVMKTYNEASPPICHYQNTSLTNSTTFLCRPNLVGQYVRIRKAPLSDASATNILALCDVEVHGMALGHYHNEFHVEVLQSRHDDAPRLCSYKTLAVDRSVMFWCNPSPRGRYVRISKKDAEVGFHILKLCEVEVKGVPTVSVDITSENWAVGKPATQSSTEWNKPAPNAVDGNYNCGYDASITHTDVNDKFPWWMVDLETWINITAVTLYNRADCCPERLNNFAVEVIGCLFMKPDICHNQTSAVGKYITIPCNPSLRGRYVRIRKYGPIPNTAVLSLCEVEVIGIKTGESDRVCSDNWARGKPASQSSTFKEAHLAVDGNYTCGTDGSFSQTSTNNLYPWWMVDLLHMFTIVAVKVYNRQDCCQDRLKNFAIEILKSSDDTGICYNRTSRYVETSEKFFCNPHLDGRYVKIQQYGSVSDYISLCEVEVFGSKVVPGLESEKWARGMPAIQSTTRNSLEARIAVDGHTSCDLGPPYTTETLESDTHPWWMVDLENIILVTSVTVFRGQESGHLQNWALGKPTWQTSTYGHRDAHFATDGQYDCKLSYSQTDIRDPAPTWVVNLEQTILVTEVTLYNCCGGTHLHDFYVEVMQNRFTETDTVICHYQRLPIGSSASFACPYAKGRAVRIRKEHLQSINDFLALCEVEVKGKEIDTLLKNFVIDVLKFPTDPRPSLCHEQVEPVKTNKTILCDPPVEGRYVRITKHSPLPPGYTLALCEVEVKGYKTGDSDNWALGKPAFMSSTYAHRPAQFAVDGNYDCKISFSQTRYKDKEPTWVVDLEQTILVSEVKLFNRQDCCETHLRNFFVEVMQTLNTENSTFVCHHQISAIGTSASFRCPSVQGRFVRIRKVHPVSDDDVLSLCEVEVKGMEMDNGVHNWAWKKPAFQSGTFPEYCVAGLAVDGNFKCHVPNDYSKSSIYNSYPFWMVNLEAAVLVTEVKITMANESLYNFYIEVMMSPFEKTSSVCHHQTGSAPPYAVFPCRPSLKGRFVRIRKQGPLHEQYVALCELEVFGTKIVNTENLAWGMPTFQSSKHTESKLYAAVDGIFNCHLKESCEQTAPGDKGPWWMVDLQKNVEVSAVKIFTCYQCNSCDDNLHNFYIETMMDLKQEPNVCHHQVSKVNGTGTYFCTTAWLARYVRIRKEVNDIDSLSFCEVEVYANSTETHAPNLAVWADDKTECGKIMKPPTSGDVKSILCPPMTLASSVKIVKTPAYHGDTLSMCEVEVYGSPINRNWAFGMKAYLFVPGTVGNHSIFHAVNYIVDGDVSNGFSTPSCPTYHATEPIILIVDLYDRYVLVEKIVYLTTAGPKEAATYRNLVVMLYNSDTGFLNNNACHPDREVFEAGLAIKVLCSGKTRVANHVIVKNDPQEREFLACEVEVYGTLAKLKTPPKDYRHIPEEWHK
ncbi:uncharacterized protein LOC121376881 [Gigantopelta aegis]|uniref:uncharacterized protein LOC121376881 n=1 Tax=Gigantopelta aegis TaxID=1735272 RepID=UPI001B8886F5|nr:uncharacterized protein LOC121376881 [Gigantopelta aegis]